MTDLIAGAYAKGGAHGLHTLRWSGQALTTNGTAAPFVNVSGGARVPGTDRWWLVDEVAHRLTLADAAAGWHVLANVGSGGKAPCHLAIDAGGQWLAVANYESGAVALFPLAQGGAPGQPDVFRNAGGGPVAGRQDGPHAHWTGFAPNGLLYATDLGSDEVLHFGPDHRTPATAYAAPAGSGPRQLAFHPRLPVAFLVSELTSTLTVLDIADDGALHPRAILSTLPEGAADSLGGAIALSANGRHLYVSNRGPDSIAAFAIGAGGGATPIGHAPSGGRSPRFLLLVDQERTLLVAHEEGGGVTALSIDATGLPQPTPARADVPGACFLGVLA